MDAAARIRAIDPEACNADVASQESALRRYLGALGLADGPIEWTDDLTLARRRYCAGRGRWPVFSTRQAALGAHRWLPGSAEIPLVRAERRLRTLLVGPGRPARSVRLATELALGLEAAGADVGRRQEALETVLGAAEAGVMAWWPSNGGLVAVPRPAMQFEAGILHSWDGKPAVRWPTGRRLGFWRGVHMPVRVDSAPDRLTVARIAATTNAERRRVMIERLGYERYLREAGAELRAQDDFGRLWAVRGRYALDREEPLVLVEVVNATPEPDGSYRRYFLHVPPETRTAREAVAWTFGYDSAGDYLVAIET